MAELRAAIDDLYEAFADCQLPENTDFCPCCHTPEQESELRRYPLREIPEKSLYPYAVSAMLTWGGSDVLRHFVPRLLDVAAFGDETFADPEGIFGSLRHGRWNTWPDREQEAIRNYFRALWIDRLSKPPVEMALYNIDTWLCSIRSSRRRHLALLADLGSR